MDAVNGWCLNSMAWVSAQSSFQCFDTVG